MDKGCEGILAQGKGLGNSRKLKKVVAIYKTGKLILSKKFLKKVPEKGYRLGKITLLKKQMLQTYFH